MFCVVRDISEDEREEVNEIENSIEETHEDSEEGISKHLHEVLAVHKTNTVVDPGTMMVHIEYTSVTLGTVMGSFWFEYTANQTVSLSILSIVLRLVLAIPTIRHFPRINQD